jgi:hypothetical protein
MVFHRFLIERQVCSLTTRFSTKQIVRYNDAQKGEAKMLQLTNIFMDFINRKLFITFMCAGLLIMAVGCEKNESEGGCLSWECNNETNNDQNNAQNNAQNNTTFVETNTPLGCDKANDRYYDFQETKKCLRPTTKEQQYILYRYQWVNEVAKDTPNDIIKIRVGFKDYLTSQQYQTLIVEEGKILEIKEIDLFYPDLDKNGLGGNFGLRTGQIVARENMLSAAHQDFIETFSMVGGTGYPQYAQEDMQNFGIAIVEVTMKASEVPQWWDDHKDQVRFIQTIITDMDSIQTPFYPSIVIGGENQVINWDK